MRLIDADALAMHYTDWQLSSDEEERDVIEEAIRAIDNAPTIDAVPVVRCKDCKHSIDYYNDGECYCRHPRYNGETLLYIADGYGHYCSFGERKDDDKSCDTCKYYDKGWDDIVCDGCTKAYSNWEEKTMSDYIKREDVLGEFTYDDLDEYYTPQIMAIVENIPSADVAPVRHGRWEPYSIEPEAYDIAGVKSWAKKYRCSECRFIHTVIEDFGIYTFCPNCGARMDGEK